MRIAQNIPWQELSKTKRHRFLLFIGAFLAVPLIGFSVSYITTYIFPQAHNSAVYTALLILGLFALLLAIPIAMLTLISYATHVLNPREKVLKVDDVKNNRV